MVISLVSQNFRIFRIINCDIAAKIVHVKISIVTHATNGPPAIFSITARALRHLNKLRCIFRIQNIDFPSQKSNTYLWPSFELCFMPASCMSIQSQAIKIQSFRRTFARPSEKKKTEQYFNLSISLFSQLRSDRL